MTNQCCPACLRECAAFEDINKKYDCPNDCHSTTSSWRVEFKDTFCDPEKVVKGGITQIRYSGTQNALISFIEKVEASALQRGREEERAQIAERVYHELLPSGSVDAFDLIRRISAFYDSLSNPSPKDV